MLTEEIKSFITSTQQRASAAGYAYAGAFTPKEALAVLEQMPEAVLVDVRTKAERDWVGRVLVPKHQHDAVEWNEYPSGEHNPRFMEQLAQIAKPEQTILFLCRSGVRSRHAATLATANGYPHCFDILEGFEGDKDSAGHRKTIGGWCVAGLPWVGA